MSTTTSKRTTIPTVCPFCGKEQSYEYLGTFFRASVVMDGDGAGWLVWCRKCKAAGPPASTPAGAIRRFRHRPLTDSEPR